MTTPSTSSSFPPPPRAKWSSKTTRALIDKRKNRNKVNILIYVRLYNFFFKLEIRIQLNPNYNIF